MVLSASELGEPYKLATTHLTFIEDPADHPRENHEEHGQQLQVAA